MKNFLLFATIALAVACGASEERAREARLRFAEAVAAGDSVAALKAVEDLRDALPQTPESALEQSRLLFQIGESNRAWWLLQEEISRHPDRKDLRLVVGETALLVGDAASAFDAVQGIEPGDKEHAQALRVRSRAQLALGNLEAGLATLERGEELYPDRIRFRIDRIETLVAEERFEDALELVRDALEREEIAEDRRVWLRRVESGLLKALGEADAALALLETLTEEYPEDVDAWARRARILIDEGRAEEARTVLAEAAESRPELGMLHAMLAIAHQANGDAEAAEAAMRERIARAPDLGGVHDLAEFLHRDGRSTEGAAVIEEAIEAGWAEGSVELEYLRVAMLLGAGDLEGAERSFREFENRHRDDPRTEYLRARFDLARGDAASAAKRLKEVLPRLDRPDVQHWLGVALERIGDNEGAEYRYGLAVQRNPDQLSSYPGLIRALERRAAWGAAGQYAKALLMRSPTNGVAFDALVRSLRMRGNATEAEKVLREFVRQYPDLAAPTVALSEVLREQGRAAESLTLLDEASARLEGEPVVVAERAIVLKHLGRGEEGLALLAKAETEGDHASLHRARAFLLLSAGKGSEGLQEVERALVLEPENPASLRLAGDYQSRRGEFGAAARSYERYLAVRPGDAEVAFRLGIARERSGDAAGAIEAYRQTLVLDQRSVGARNNLALALEKEGRIEEALEMAQSAYARSEDNPVVMDTLGSLYLRVGRHERAIALLEKALALEPQNIESRYHLAIAFRETGRVDEARKLLNELDSSLAGDHELRDRVSEAVASLP